MIFGALLFLFGLSVAVLNHSIYRSGSIPFFKISRAQKPKVFLGFLFFMFILAFVCVAFGSLCALGF